MAPGEAVHCPLGERGAHQVSNPTDEEVRFLAASTNGAPDIVVYPDSEKIGAGERLPEGGGLHTFFDLDSQVDHWKGETAPQSARHLWPYAAQATDASGRARDRRPVGCFG